MRLKNYNIFTSNNQIIKNIELLQLKNLFLTERNFFYILNKMKQKKGMRVATTQKLISKLKKISPGAQLLHKIFAGRVVYSIAPRREKSGLFKAIKFLKESVLMIKNKPFEEKIAAEILHPTGAISLKRSYDQLLAEGRLNYRRRYSFSKKKIKISHRFARSKIYRALRAAKAYKNFRNKNKRQNKLILRHFFHPAKIMVQFAVKKSRNQRDRKHAKRIKKLLRISHRKNVQFKKNLRRYCTLLFAQNKRKLMSSRKDVRTNFPKFNYPKLSDNYFNNIEQINTFYKKLTKYNTKFIQFFFPGLLLPPNLSVFTHKLSKKYGKTSPKIKSLYRPKKPLRTENILRHIMVSNTLSAKAKIKLFKQYFFRLSITAKKQKIKQYNKIKKLNQVLPNYSRLLGGSRSFTKLFTIKSDQK